MKTALIVFFFVLVVAFIGVILLAAFRVARGTDRATLEGRYHAVKEKKIGIREGVSAVLNNTRTGDKTVIRKRTLWEKLTRRV